MSATISATGRNRAVDLLKLALALMVVGIHASPLAGLGNIPRLISAEGLFRLGVPVFLLFNGFYLQGAIAAGRGWAVVKRAAQLYVLWMALYVPVAWPIWSNAPWRQKIFTLVIGYWHLWYLSGFALAAALAVALAHWSAGRLAALAAALLLSGLAVFYAMGLGLIAPDPDLFMDPLLPHRNALFVCVPFLLAGVLIRRLDLAARWRRGPVLALAGLGVGLVMAESLALGLLAPVGVSHDTMLSLAIAAPLLAIAALQWPGTASGRALGDYASGIYFLHVAFCAYSYRYTDLPSAAIYVIAVAGAVAGTWAIRRAGLERRLL